MLPKQNIKIENMLKEKESISIIDFIDNDLALRDALFERNMANKNKNNSIDFTTLELKDI